jgi:hypothetical protein
MQTPLQDYTHRYIQWWVGSYETKKFLIMAAKFEGKEYDINTDEGLNDYLEALGYDVEAINKRADDFYNHFSKKLLSSNGDTTERGTNEGN